MSDLLSLTLVDQSSWLFSGELTVAAISDNWRQFDKKRPRSGLWSIDCKAVDRVDSAGIAYLLSCMRYAKYKDLELEIVNFPKALSGLVKAQGVSEFFSRF